MDKRPLALLCAECNRQGPYPVVLSTASECGHQSMREGMKWCGRCALGYGVCRKCGKKLNPSKASPPSRG